jgi:hypothetical protein
MTPSHLKEPVPAIPEDLFQIACSIIMEAKSLKSMLKHRDVVDAFAAALVAERDRCAAIAGYYAQACLETESDGSGYYACSALMDEIRNPNSTKQPSRPIHDEDLPF